MLFQIPCLNGENRTPNSVLPLGFEPRTRPYQGRQLPITHMVGCIFLYRFLTALSEIPNSRPAAEKL